MKTNRLFIALAAAGVLVGSSVASRANIVISEMHSTGSSNASYGADWFELTNTGSSAVNISGWKVDDSSNALATAVALRNVTSIPAGASVVFFEGNSTGTTDATIEAAFKAAWFGSNVPAGFLIGAYGGSGIGLSSSADAVNLFDSTGTPVTGVSFGAATPAVTFDNAAGLSGAVSQLSVAGTNGAFVSFDGAETGSPGTIGAATAVPEPATVGLLALGGLAALRRRRHA